MPSGENSGGRWLWITVAFIAAVLLAYSQTLSLTWDEGFHLLAAHMILAGKRPYVDFIFAQTPLNAYWVAVWMRVIGESWHTAHALAALESAGAVALVADYLYRRYPNATWRVEAAIAGAVFTGLNVVVVEYGTLGQAYGICLLLTVAAFRFAVLAPGRRSMVWATLAGFAAGAAAASSLLTVTVAPVVLDLDPVAQRRGQPLEEGARVRRRNRGRVPAHAVAVSRRARPGDLRRGEVPPVLQGAQTQWEGLADR